MLFMVIPDPTKNYYNNDTYVWEQYPYIDSLRNDEFSSSISTSNVNSFDFVVFYSTKSLAKLSSILSIARTIFVCVVLSIASYYFTNDANTLVLNPIERMLEKVRLIAKNPLAAASDEVQKAGVLSVLAKEEESKGKKKNKSSGVEEGELETEVLEKAIVKIGHLLALGFGEAGAKIITANISKGGDIDPMMAG